MAMTNEEFGRRIGVGHSMASRIRNGQRCPGVGTLARIHEVLGIPLVELTEKHRKGPEAFGKLIRRRMAELEKEPA
jgi:transcriptional regulator with XRE-family HTH domain